MDPTKPAISIAFEGAITDGLLGEFVHTPKSIDGAMDALQELGRKYRLIIVTSSPESKLEDIHDWIVRNRGARHFTFEVRHTRPAAVYYIEKRAIKFENWQQVMHLLG